MTFGKFLDKEQIKVLERAFSATDQSRQCWFANKGLTFVRGGLSDETTRHVDIYNYDGHTILVDKKSAAATFYPDYSPAVVEASHRFSELLTEAVQQFQVQGESR